MEDDRLLGPLSMLKEDMNITDLVGISIRSLIVLFSLVLMYLCPSRFDAAPNARYM